MAAALSFLVHATQNVNLLKKMKRKKPKKGRESSAPFARKATYRNDAEGLEFFILVPIIQIVNLPLKQNPRARSARNVAV